MADCNCPEGYPLRLELIAVPSSMIGTEQLLITTTGDGYTLRHRPPCDKGDVNGSEYFAEQLLSTPEKPSKPFIPNPRFALWQKAWDEGKLKNANS